MGDGTNQSRRLDRRSTELLREVPVALVLGRDRHDRPGPVPHEHVVRDEDRDRCVVHGVRRERAGEDTGLLLALGLALELALLPVNSR